MLNLFIENPWLVLCGMIGLVTVACVAIVFITDYLRKSHQAEIDASLKEDMLNRGMCAADIKTVLEASADGEAARLANCGNQGVRVGLGKLQVEVGAVRTTDAAAPGAAVRNL